METDYGSRKDIARKHLLDAGEKIENALSGAAESYGAGFAAKLEELVMAGTIKAFGEMASGDPEFICGIKTVGKIYREEISSVPYAKDIPAVWKHNVLRSYRSKTNAMEYSMAIDLFESLFEEEMFSESPKKKEQDTAGYISKIGGKLESAVENAIVGSTLTEEQLSQYLDKALVDGTGESMDRIRKYESKFDAFFTSVVREFSMALKDAPHPGLKLEKSRIIDSLRKHRPKENRMLYDQTIDMLETRFLGKKRDEEE